MIALNKDGGGAGRQIRDIYLRHAHYLQRYSTGEAERLVAILDTANKDIKALISKAKSIDTKKQYARVAGQIKQITKQLNEQLYGQIHLDFEELAAEEVAFVEKSLKTIGVKAELGLVNISPQRIWAAASFGSYAENVHERFDTYVKGLSDNVYKVWDTQVRAGYIAGLTAQQINRTVLGSIKDMEPGQMQGLRNSLERHTRTMISFMAETARDEVYRANDDDIFDGYQYLATLDTRTCLVCGADDGKIFKNLDEAPKLPRHLNDRCLYVPYIKGLEDIPSERAAMDGPVSDKTTYADWLKNQSPELQKDILGSTRYMAYKNGMPISSFVSDGRTLTLRQLMEKEGLEFFGAGLKTGSRQAQNAYADTYYESIRNRKNPTDIAKIAENTGFAENNIQSIREHIFIKEHDLGEGVIDRFSTDWQIAQSWQRMEQGWKGNSQDKYREADILLLRHELEELTLIAKYGYNASEAHIRAEEKYPWDIMIDRIK
jgi:hypothetical protein